MTLSFFDRDELIGATYARISTAKQKDGISLNDQDERMNFYAERNNITLPPEYRFKEQESGFKEERSEYEKIRQLIRERRMNVLIVYGSDRHTRDPIHGDIFRAELRRNNVALHIIMEGGEVDIISPTGQFIRRQMDNFNWYWGKMIQQTTQDKKRAYTRQGVPYQQGTPRYGYRRVGKQADAHLEIVEAIRPTIEKLFTWFDEGVSPHDMVKRLEGTPTPADIRSNKNKKRPYGVWEDSTIYQILKDEIYAGVYHANKYKVIEDETGKKKRINNPKEEWIPMQVPAIVSRDLWERVQRKLDVGRSRFPRLHAKYPYLLARLSTCRMEVEWGKVLSEGRKVCGYSIRGITNPERRSAHYICNSRVDTLARGKCCLPYFRIRETDEEVWKFVKELLENPQAMLATLRDAQEMLRREQEDLYQRVIEIDELIAQHTGELNTLVREFRQAQGSILFDIIKQQAIELEEIIKGLQASKAKLTAKLSQHTISDEEIAALERFAEEVRPRLPHATFQDKREIIEALRFTFEFAYEDEQYVVYVMWHSYEFPLVIYEDSASSRRSLRADRRVRRPSARRPRARPRTPASPPAI